MLLQRLPDVQACFGRPGMLDATMGVRPGADSPAVHLAAAVLACDEGEGRGAVDMAQCLAPVAAQLTEAVAFWLDRGVAGAGPLAGRCAGLLCRLVDHDFPLPARLLPAMLRLCCSQLDQLRRTAASTDPTPAELHSTPRITAVADACNVYHAAVELVQREGRLPAAAVTPAESIVIALTTQLCAVPAEMSIWSRAVRLAVDSGLVAMLMQQPSNRMVGAMVTELLSKLQQALRNSREGTQEATRQQQQDQVRLGCKQSSTLAEALIGTAGAHAFGIGRRQWT